MLGSLSGVARYTMYVEHSSLQPVNRGAYLRTLSSKNIAPLRSVEYSRGKLLCCIAIGYSVAFALNAAKGPLQREFASRTPAVHVSFQAHRLQCIPN